MQDGTETRKNTPWPFRTATSIIPTAIKYGAGRIKELAEFCKANGIKRPLVVTDKGLAAMPMVAEIMADLKKAGLKAALFADVRPNPVEENVLAGCKAFKDGKHDGVVALGGGSGLDIGKMIALMHSQKISIFDLEDIGDWWTQGRCLADRAHHRGADDGGHGLGSGPRRRRHPPDHA